MASGTENTKTLVRMVQEAIGAATKMEAPDATNTLLTVIAGSLAHIAVQLDTLNIKVDKVHDDML